MTEERKKVVFKARTIFRDGRMYGIGNIEEEKWRSIPEYDEYAVSNWGNIKQGNFYVKITLKLEKYKYRKLQYRLWKNGVGKTISVATIVNQVFNGSAPSDKHTTDHIDIDSTNNYYKNLKWSTPSEQARNQAFRHGRQYVGVYRHGHGWRAQIGIAGKNIKSIIYNNPHDAARRYNQYLIEYGITDRQPNIIE